VHRRFDGVGMSDASGRCMMKTSSILVVALAGCAATPSYVYSPQPASYWSDGYPASVTPVPPEAPQGKVEVTSFGIVEIQPEGAQPLPVLHVRLAIANEGDAVAWTLVPSEQLVEIPGEGRSRPIYVNTDVRTLPSIEIAQRDRRILDFYYPLPANVDGDEDLRGFDVLWQVTTPARVFASRTRFGRLEEEPMVRTGVTFYAGWGPYWWYDPFYPRAVFVHHRPIVVHRPGRVIVTRPPVGHYRAIRDHRR
jgi:hypothetical protein